MSEYYGVVKTNSYDGGMYCIKYLDMWVVRYPKKRKWLGYNLTKHKELAGYWDTEEAAKSSMILWIKEGNPFKDFHSPVIVKVGAAPVTNLSFSEEVVWGVSTFITYPDMVDYASPHLV